MKRAKANWRTSPQTTVRQGNCFRLFDKSHAHARSATNPKALINRNCMSHLLQVLRGSHVPREPRPGTSIPLPRRLGISKTIATAHAPRRFHFSFRAGQKGFGNDLCRARAEWHPVLDRAARRPGGEIFSGRNYARDSANQSDAADFFAALEHVRASVAGSAAGGGLACAHRPAS